MLYFNYSMIMCKIELWCSLFVDVLLPILNRLVTLGWRASCGRENVRFKPWSGNWHLLYKIENKKWPKWNAKFRWDWIFFIEQIVCKYLKRFSKLLIVIRKNEIDIGRKANIRTGDVARRAIANSGRVLINLIHNHEHSKY